MIKDITERKEVKAIEVFKHAIDYFRDLMLGTIDKKGLGVKEENIRWVLTVPAIWSDPAKQFMTEAAELVNMDLRHPPTHFVLTNAIPFEKLIGNQLNVLTFWYT